MVYSMFGNAEMIFDCRGCSTERQEKCKLGRMWKEKTVFREINYNFLGEVMRRVKKSN